MEDIQDIVNTIEYVSTTAGQTTTPANCNTYDCIIFDEFRKIAKLNGFQTNSLIPYTRALSFFTQLVNNFYSLGLLKSSDISSALSAGGFTSSNNLTFDECICIIKLFTVSYLQQARLNIGSLDDDDLESEADTVTLFQSQLPNRKCKGYNNSKYYSSQ